MNRRCALLPAVAATVLCACSSMSGLDAMSQYACKAPAGVKCESVSGTYHNALQNNLPAQRQRGETAPRQDPAAAPPPALPTSSVSGIDRAPAPIRSQPRVLRLWIKPWEDSDRDLHDQGYVYVQIDQGRWLVDHAPRQTREAYAPIRAPRALASTPGNSDAKAAVARPAAQPANDAVAQALRALQGGSAQDEQPEGER